MRFKKESNHNFKGFLTFLTLIIIFFHNHYYCKRIDRVPPSWRTRKTDIYKMIRRAPSRRHDIEV